MAMNMARLSLRSASDVVSRHVVPVLSSWWENPLLQHARRQHPLPLSLLRVVIPIASGIIALMAILAWALILRPVGAGIMAFSVGAVILPVLIAPIFSANWVARRMQNPAHDPRRMTDVYPVDVAWGLALVMLWRLRWLLVIALAVTPSLVIGMLHVRVSDYQVWQQSAQVLGSASEAARADYLTVSGGIPYFRLIVQALTTPLMLWLLLPLMISLGVAAALILDDPILSDLAALIGGGLILVVLFVLWENLARTPSLSGSLEMLRLLLLLGVIGGVIVLTRLTTRWSASLIYAYSVNGDASAPEFDEH